MNEADEVTAAVHTGDESMADFMFMYEACALY